MRPEPWLQSALEAVMAAVRARVPAVISTNELAERLHVSVRQIRALEASEYFHRPVSRRTTVLFRVGDIEAWLRERTRT